MKNNICFKLFTLVFVFFFFAISVFATETAPSVLTKIVIEPTADNSFNFNLYFDKQFTSNAFLQKKQQGIYNVFIPDTIINPKKTKLIYVNNEDSDIVKVSMEEKPFIKKDSEQSNYVKLTVDIANDYAIRLLAKTEEPKTSSLPFLFVNFYSFVIIIALALMLFFTLRMFMKSKKQNKSVTYTHFPSSYLNSPQDYIYSLSTGVDNTPQRPILPKVNIKKNLKTADSDSFSCFDIPLAEEPKQSSYEFKSTLKQTSNIMKERTLKSKQTNPMQRKYTEENNEFSLPVVEDLPNTVQNKEAVKENKDEPELLSVLNITPNKGFYLTTADNDMFALFGFVGDNVFLLKKFIDLSQINLQARFYDRAQNGNEQYIVRMDSYKAMIEISNTGMRETAVL